MYTQLRQLRRIDSENIIFRPEDYASVQQLKLAPVVAIEASELAGDFPLVWRTTTSTPELCALTSLTGRGAFEPNAPRRHTRIRPLAVEAYPLAMAPGRSESEYVLLIDDVPGSNGPTRYPVFEPDGSFTVEAQRRVDALKVFAADLNRTRQLTGLLEAAGLLTAWPVQLQIDTEIVEIKGLSIVSTAPADQAKLPALVEKADYGLVELLTLHTLSLFNMKKLVDRHRLAARPPPNEGRSDE
jgi:hypothetical protein